MKILIVEDDFSFAIDVEIGLKALGYSDIKIVDNVEDALKVVCKDGPGLLIIDVNLNNNLSGIDLANKLAAKQVPIIFITALNDETTFREAMQVNPSAFLVKPFDKVTLQSCIDRAVRQNIKRVRRGILKSLILDDCFFIKQNDLLKKIKFADILWIEADGNYIEIHVNQRRFVTKMSLTRVQEKMNTDYFVRVHKKFLVNIRKIDDFISTSELLINGKPIPVGSRYRSNLLEIINSVDY